MSALSCGLERRRHEVRRRDYCGLDYLEVSHDQRTLHVWFLGRAPQWLTAAHLRVDGGLRIRNVAVRDVAVEPSDHPDLDDRVAVRLDRTGDFSTYTLRLVDVGENGRQLDRPPEGVDPRYASLDFTFKLDCPTGLDCGQEPACPPEDREQPDIDYLAKDYASFRRLILDRLALLMPGWRDDRVPDIGVTLAELLAYVGDRLSYYQDAVATEAYLSTARRRVSVRRHARLVDYALHEGCNARAWVCLRTDADLELDPTEAFFITSLPELAQPAGKVLHADDLAEIPAGRYEVFEPLTDAPIRVRRAHNRISLYTWGDRECCLPAGATGATLRDDWVDEKAGRRLDLRPGDVLVLEEVTGPTTGDSADADPTHRHAVRLTHVEPDMDPLFDQPVVEVSWAEADALPFPLCLETTGPDCEPLTDVSVACGNVVLVDHGRRVGPEDLGEVEGEPPAPACPTGCCPEDPAPVPARYRPVLGARPLTFASPIRQRSRSKPAAHADESEWPMPPSAGAASRTLEQDPRAAVPQVELAQDTGAGPAVAWTPRADLLASGPSDRHFVVEVDEEGRPQLRFGDGELGRAPEVGSAFRASYRIGNGPGGNVGAETIRHLVLRSTRLSGVSVAPRNPLAATGGAARESVEEARLFAPHSLRSDQQRAITADDYARLAQRLRPDVQRAAAALRWTGSWYEAFVAVDPRGREEAGEQLLSEVSAALAPYRRAGHDLAVVSAHHVPVDIGLRVCVEPDHLRGHVEAELLRQLGNRRLPDGRLGFFHADNLTFGDGVRLSSLVAVAQAVQGVRSVEVTRLERLFEGDQGEIDEGILRLGPFEVARLDNDPSLPEQGRLRLEMRGGR